MHQGLSLRLEEDCAFGSDSDGLAWRQLHRCVPTLTAVPSQVHPRCQVAAGWVTGGSASASFQECLVGSHPLLPSSQERLHSFAQAFGTLEVEASTWLPGTAEATVEPVSLLLLLQGIWRHSPTFSAQLFCVARWVLASASCLASPLAAGSHSSASRASFGSQQLNEGQELVGGLVWVDLLLGQLSAAVQRWASY